MVKNEKSKNIKNTKNTKESKSSENKNNLNILEEYEYDIETIEQTECLEDGSFIDIDIDKIENEIK